MTSIPGLPLPIKITIQQKINKIIHQHFISPCPHHINITSSFQSRLLQTLSSSQTCILNAKLASNFKHKSYSSLNVNHLLTCKPYLKTPKHLLNILCLCFVINSCTICIDNSDFCRTTCRHRNFVFIG